MLHYLLQQDPAEVDVEDVHGWTPLAWALTPPARLDNVSTPVHSVLFDTNRKDRAHSRTPLLWTASHGLPPIARMLVYEEGIELETEDDSERTRRLHGAGDGNSDAVRLLVETGKIDLDSEDKRGRMS